MNLLLPEAVFWYTISMKMTDELANEADGEKPRFIREESADEGWTVTPIGHRPGDPIPDDFDPFEEDEDENNDTSFYTREDYENNPILRQILIDLGGDDPLADEETDDDDDE